MREIFCDLLIFNDKVRWNQHEVPVHILINVRSYFIVVNTSSKKNSELLNVMIKTRKSE